MHIKAYSLKMDSNYNTMLNSNIIIILIPILFCIAHQK